MALSQWHTTAAANSSVGTINWAEGQSPATVNDSARAEMADVRSFYENIEWRDWGHTPVYSSASAFTISDAASLSSIYAVNRRIKTIDGGGTAYATIESTTWVASTQTVTLNMDSGTLTNPMTSVALGPQVTNQPIHVSGIKNAITAGTVLLTSLLSQTGDLIYASATATAAVLAVSSTAGTGVLITGATPSWTSVPTLEQVNATSGFFDNGNRVNEVLISSTAASNSSTISFLSGITTAHSEYEITFLNILPATDGATLNMQVTTDGGTTWGTAATDYQWVIRGGSTLGNDAGASAAGTDNEILLSSNSAGMGIDSAAASGYSGNMKFFLPSSGTFHKRFNFSATYANNEAGTNPQAVITGGGAYIGSTTAINGIRFYMSAGNIASGTFKLKAFKDS